VRKLGHEVQERERRAGRKQAGPVIAHLTGVVGRPITLHLVTGPQPPTDEHFARLRLPVEVAEIANLSCPICPDVLRSRCVSFAYISQSRR